MLKKIFPVPVYATGTDLSIRWSINRNYIGQVLSAYLAMLRVN